MTEKDWDFGFTVVNEDELDTVKAATSYEEKLDKMYQAIKPLLTNLKKNPEKDFIKWPDRLAKVTAFEKVIDDIYNS